MVKMIVMDLDDTLLNDNNNISDYTLSVFEKCRQKGLKIVIATARTEMQTERCINMVKPDGIIMNGGALVMTKNRDIIHKKLISKETTDGIISECNNCSDIVAISVDTEDDRFVSESTRNEPLRNTDFSYRRFYDFSKPLLQSSYSINVRSQNKKAVMEIGSKFDECKVISFTGRNVHRIALKEVNKMIGLEILVKHEKIELSEIAAFGDDYSDIEMVKECGIGVAVENAIDEVKSVAKHICGTNNEDGVGKWIEENLL